MHRSQAWLLVAIGLLSFSAACEGCGTGSTGGAGGGAGGGGGEVPDGGGDGGAQCREACAIDDCGPVPDGCGGTLECPLECPVGEQCGVLEPGKCALVSCTPVAPETVCAEKCGQVSNGCFGSLECDGTNGGVDCTGDDFCGALAPNACGNPASCTPGTCAELGHSCGLAGDGCGNIIDCWSPGTSTCPSPASQACIANPTTGAQSCVTGTPSCVGPLCSAIPSCDVGAPTRLTGTVLTPGRGGSNQLPVPNAIVYIPSDPSVALPTIPEGIDLEDEVASCGRCADEQLVADGQHVLAAAVTDYRGQFQLEGLIPVGVPFRLVVKVGKWRRVIEVPGNVAQPCATAALGHAHTRLAASTTDGLAGTHLPRIAVSTGNVDAMECVLYNIGIASSEFTLSSAEGRVHMYRGNGAMMEGACTGGASCTNNNNAGCRNGTSGCAWVQNYVSPRLYRFPERINAYDLVVFDCEGTERGDYANHRSTMRSYVENGGRLFASHWAYNWIAGNGTLADSAPWNGSGSANSDVGYISRTTGATERAGANPVKSDLLRDWLRYQDALSTTIEGWGPRFRITKPRDLAGNRVGPATDEWVYRTTGSPESPTRNTARVQQLSFNTPYAAEEEHICGRVAYSGFHVVADDTGNSNRFFPAVCSDADMSTQELILAFMLFDLASCVSAGDPPSPPVCTPTTAADLCPMVDDACGALSDGCGGIVDCGGCSEDFYCSGNQCTPRSCVPADCEARGAECGFNVDGCGGTLNCGPCPIAGQVCGAQGPNQCGAGDCVPIGAAEACTAAGAVCGQTSDGCGGLVECGACLPGQSCIYGQCYSPL